MSDADLARLGPPTDLQRLAGWAACSLAILLAGCAAPTPVASPHADLPPLGGTHSVGIGEPLLALAVSTEPRLYVLTATGVEEIPYHERFGLGLHQRRDQVGGSEWVAPADFDPTNGQDLYVADGSRVLRFSDEGRLLQTLAIPAVDRPQPTTGPTATPGEAIAVAAGVEGRVFVAEATRGVVQVWRDGALVDVLGGLGRPVSLATSGRRLYIADAEAGVVHVLDTEGRQLQVLQADALPTVLSVSLSRDRVVVLGPEAVVLFSTEGVRQRVIPISGGASLLDAAVLDDGLFVLTPDAIHFLGRLE